MAWLAPRGAGLLQRTLLPAACTASLVWLRHHSHSLLAQGCLLQALQVGASRRARRRRCSGSCGSTRMLSVVLCLAQPVLLTLLQEVHEAPRPQLFTRA